MNKKRDGSSKVRNLFLTGCLLWAGIVMAQPIEGGG